MRKRAVRSCVVAIVVAIGVLVPSAVAMAGNYPPEDPPTSEKYPGDPGNAVYPGDPGGAKDSSVLAFTGDHVLEMALIGFAVAGLGVVLVRLGRRPARI